ncbi:MAG: DUF1173 domain-containing protein [Burkholderiaceae bacterium]|nr:DUF1173 domain-containing protein [Burkholderiaceae bacterium]
MQATATESVSAAQQLGYSIAGQQFDTDSPGFAEAIAWAHRAHHRPHCLCLQSGDGRGVEMYVARLGDGFIVKRMPNTGCRHAPDCPSYEPPAEFSGLGQVLGSAIVEDPATGETTLKLDFSMSRIAGRSSVPVGGSASDRVATDGTRLSLRGLLHYLWDQAELTHWHPGFAGKRSWAVVRKHLLQAAENKVARGGALQARLYIPEVFCVEEREAINARRLAQWAPAMAVPGRPQRLMLLIAEIKEIVPARYGFKAVIKHVPDQAFLIDEQLYGRMGRRFETELGWWGSAENLHMVVIATFGVSAAGVPFIAELSLMTVTHHQWLPVEDSFEQQLVDMLVKQRRRFVKALGYNLPSTERLASAVLTDSDASPIGLFIGRHGDDVQIAEEANSDLESNCPLPVWVWNPKLGTIPPFPRKAPYSPAADNRSPDRKKDGLTTAG